MTERYLEAAPRRGIRERPLRPNCFPREAGLDDRTTLLPAVEPLTARPAAEGRLGPTASGGGFNRSMQHNNAIMRRECCDETETPNLLQ
jgi:hypothetical protein